MSEHQYNIALMGKTGTGKSTLINYLFMAPLARTGTGRPVTKRGFHPYDFQIKDLPIRIYDSWGLEADKAEEWMLELEEELSQRGPDTAAQHWFHTVFYCINAGGHRIEPYDARIINKFLNNNYKVTVILTKADLAEPDQRDAMTRAIINQVGRTVPVISVCAEDKVLRSGTRVKPFGRSQIFAQVARDFLDSICLRLPQRCVKVVQHIIEEWQQEQMTVLRRASFLDQKRARKQVLEATQGLEEEIKNGLMERAVLEELQTTLSMYRHFGLSIRDFPPGRKIETLSLSRDRQFLLNTLPLLAGPFLAPAALVAAHTIRHRQFIKSLDRYCSRLKHEAEKLGPGIAAILRENTGGVQNESNDQ